MVISQPADASCLKSLEPPVTSYRATVIAQIVLCAIHISAVSRVPKTLRWASCVAGSSPAPSPRCPRRSRPELSAESLVYRSPND